MDALLLLGPTGVGKSPLGDLLAARGVLGRRCLHFDFGACLRGAAAGRIPGLDDRTRAVIRRVLAQGRLLEDHEWPIAHALLAGFLAAHAARDGAWLVLNGLPRHEGQAAAIDALHEIRAVIGLGAPPEILHERIRRDTGGDRAGRQDDTEERIRVRLLRSLRRERPLVAHYLRRAVPVVSLDVGVETSAEALREDLERRLERALSDGA